MDRCTEVVHSFLYAQNIMPYFVLIIIATCGNNYQYKVIDEEKENSLRNIDDSFKKIIILGEYTPVLHNESGITIMSIYDFLLKENSLEL